MELHQSSIFNPPTTSRHALHNQTLRHQHPSFSNVSSTLPDALALAVETA